MFVCTLDYHMKNEFTCYSEQEDAYEDSSYIIMYSGSIFNQSELHSLAKEYAHNSPIETCQQLISFLFKRLGRELFPYLRGSFSLIIWDKTFKTLYGVRDHFGIESLYFIEEAECFYVANSKRYLEEVNRKDIIVNEQALQHYLTFQYVPEPMTLTDGCFKLTQGHFFMKKLGEPIQKYAYFTPELTPSLCKKERKIKQIQKTLVECVKERMQKGSQIGTLLSGGIDSTMITAIAQKVNPHIKTFTVGFHEQDYTEIDDAAKTAEILNVEHKKVMITPERFIKEIPGMLYYLEDPLADPSAVPLYIAYQEAKKEVDLLLSGEGADEMFGGYEIYKEHQSLKIFQYLPKLIRKPLLEFANQLPEGMKGKSFLFRGLTPLNERYVGNAKIFEEKEKEKILFHYCANNKSEKKLEKYFDRITMYHPMEQMQYIDWNTWLPGNILLKANRLSRALDLDVHFPYVDQTIYKIAKQLKVEEKIYGKTTKAILRDAAEGLVPYHILHQKKRGFPVPLKMWFRKELFTWAESNIVNANTCRHIDKDYALMLLYEHVQHKHDHSRKLWTIIIFNIWYEIFIERSNLAVNKGYL